MTRLAWGAASDVGRVRAANQDTYFVSPGLFVVADGMGGHRGGEVASELAANSVRDQLADAEHLSTDQLVDAVQEANRTVVAAASDDPDLTGMGTTLCALAIVDDDGTERLAIVNVGDSRVYLLKAGELDQITDDHSLVATLERQGRITADEAAVHPQRNILTRALGIDSRVMVDSWEVRAVAGDRYLLCSDGLFNEVDPARMAATLRKLASPDEAARELIRLANEGGGRDNITVVVVDVEAGPDQPEPVPAEATTADDADPSGPGAAGGVAVPVGATATATLDDRVIRAIPGETRPRPTAQPTPPPTRKERRAARRAAERAVAGPSGPRFTWRVVLFVVAVAAIVGLTVAAITYYARDSYFVAFRGNTVTIFRGRPGGVLWIKPEVVENTGVARGDVPAAYLDEIGNGKVEPSLDDARRYVTNVQSVASQQSGTSSSTSTSVTTTAPPTTAATAPTTATTTAAPATTAG